jgi:hypothetical protein
MEASELADNNMLNYNGYLWILSADQVWKSIDGQDWKKMSSSTYPKRRQAGTVVYQNKMWMIAGKSASVVHFDVWSSSDGEAWTQVTNNAGLGDRHSFKVTE